MNLNPDTSLALIQSAQGQTAAATNNLKNVKANSLTEKELERLDEVSKDFEAVFVTEMMKPMFAELKPDERFGGGKGEEIFQGMMLQEYGKLMAETGQFGIADQVKRQLIEMQGGRPEGTIPTETNEPTMAVTANNPLDQIIEELNNE